MENFTHTSYYYELAEKWRNGTISLQEMVELESWFDETGEISVEIPSSFTASEKEHARRIMAGINRKINRSALVRSTRPQRWFRYAAAIVLMLGAGSYLWFANQRNDHPLTNDNKRLSSEIIPGGNKAVLTLADGSTIVLDSVGNGTLAQQGNAQVVKLANGQIAYQLKGASQGEVMMNTMSTPKGGKYQLVLPDGSKVWLNAASSITYPAVFTGTQRNVSITGEVYFEIVTSKAKPFMVNVDGKSLIEVLGTHFNVNSYSDEGSIKTTLIEGGVKVTKGNQGTVLKPGQQAVVLSSADKMTVVNNANVEQALAWKNGYFNFDDADIQTVMRRIARWYDVEVVYEGKAPTDLLMGKLPMNASIAQVLKILEKIGIHFTIEGKKIIVKP